MISQSLIAKLRGAAIILLGVLLLLFNFGFFQRLGTAIFVLISLFLIVVGFFDAGFHKHLTNR
jgi:hypothetical membrane protein